MNNLLNLNPQKIKKMKLAELEGLANDIRKFLIDVIKHNGGHLGPNLGVVELTIALHYVFNSPDDQFIFDIGHQAYTHKILTGRAKGFDKLRRSGGVSGFTNYDESKHDIWESGHAGTSLSALMGVLYSNKIDKSNNHAIAIVGDGALSSGMSLEALNLIGYHKLPGIIVINNNKMSISKSVGTISELLNNDFDNKKQFFNQLGYNFVEVEDGHNITDLIKSFEEVKKTTKPVVVLVNTIKGKGLEEAENDKIGKYHMVSSNKSDGTTWSALIADMILEIQEEIPTMVVVPAMEVGSHLTKFKEAYPNRFLDVGISEEHAATMSAALAKNNKNVILSLYSTFSQRAFDQILNDIARSNQPVLITIDRAGLIPGDGDTHQGIYDVSMFNIMPNIVISAPSNAQDASDLLRVGLKSKSPFVLRFPRGFVEGDLRYEERLITINWDQVLTGDEINIISYGPLVERIKEICKTENISANLFNAKFIRPIDYNMLQKAFNNQKPILIIEEGVNTGSLYPEILRFKENMGLTSPLIDKSIKNTNIPHLASDEILEFTQFDNKSLSLFIKNAIR